MAESLYEKLKKDPRLLNRVVAVPDVTTLQKVGGAALTGLEHVGRTVDYPGKLARSTLAGDPAWGYRENFSGRDLLETYGILDKNTPGLDTGDVVGFGAELALDPLTYLTAGIGKAVNTAGKGAKAIKAAGVLDDFGKVQPSRIAALLDDASDAAKPIRAALESRGVTKAMAESALSNVDEVARAADAASLADKLKVGKTWGEKIRMGEGGLATMSVPFTDKGFNVGTGELSAKIADKLGAAGNKLYRSPPSKLALGLVSEDPRLGTNLADEQADVLGTVLKRHREGVTAREQDNIMQGLDIVRAAPDDEAMTKALTLAERKVDPFSKSIAGQERLIAKNTGRLDDLLKSNAETMTREIEQKGQKALGQIQREIRLAKKNAAWVRDQAASMSDVAVPSKVKNLLNQADNLDARAAKLERHYEDAVKAYDTRLGLVPEMAKNQPDVARVRQRIKSGENVIGDLRTKAQAYKEKFPAPSTASDDLLERTVAQARDRQAKLIPTEQEWGIPSQQLESDTVQYAGRRMPSEEFAGKPDYAMLGTNSNKLNKIRMEGKRVLGREMNTKELNDALEAAGEGRPYSQDLAVMTVARQALHDKHVAKAQAVHELVTNIPAPVAGQSTVKLESLLTQLGLDPKAPKWIGFAEKEIPREAVEFMAKQLKPWDISDAARNALKVFDLVTQKYKELLTVPFPGFDTRNFMGSIILQLQSGQSPMRILNGYTKAFKLAAGANVTQDVAGLGRLTREQIIREFAKHGIIDRNMIDDVLGAIGKNAPDSSDVMREAVEALKGGSALETPVSAFKRGTNLYSKTMGAMKAKSRMVENITRMSVALDALDQGMDLAHAARQAKTVLFDYAALTGTEKQVFKRLFPFWTFARKNAEAQAKYLFTQPGQFNAINKVLSTASDEERQDMPKYWRKEYVSRLGTSKKGDPTYIHGFGTPQEDFLEKFSNPASNLAMLNPILKSILEKSTGKLFLTGKDIEDENKAWNFFKILPEATRKQMGIETYKDKNGVERMIMNPVTKWWILQSPLSRMITTFDKGAADTDIKAKALNTLTGMRVNDLDVEKEREYRQKEAKEAMYRAKGLEGKAKKYEVWGKGPIEDEEVERSLKDDRRASRRRR